MAISTVNPLQVTELLLSTLCYLPYAHLLRTARVSKNWYRVVQTIIKLRKSQKVHIKLCLTVVHSNGMEILYDLYPIDVALECIHLNVNVKSRLLYYTLKPIHPVWLTEEFPMNIKVRLRKIEFHSMNDQYTFITYRDILEAEKNKNEIIPITTTTTTTATTTNITTNTTGASNRTYMENCTGNKDGNCKNGFYGNDFVIDHLEIIGSKLLLSKFHIMEHILLPMANYHSIYAHSGIERWKDFNTKLNTYGLGLERVPNLSTLCKYI